MNKVWIVQVRTSYNDGVSNSSRISTLYFEDYESAYDFLCVAIDCHYEIVKFLED